MGTYEKLRYLVGMRKNRLNRIHTKMRREKTILGFSLSSLVIVGLILIASPSKLLAGVLLLALFIFGTSAQSLLTLQRYASREEEVLTMAEEKEEHYSKSCYLEDRELL